MESGIPIRVAGEWQVSKRVNRDAS